MTIDKSLRTRKGIVRARNVLTRAERIEKLMQQDRWSESEEGGPCGLPKVRVYRIVVKKKKKKKGEEEGGAETTAVAAKPAAKPAAKKK